MAEREESMKLAESVSDLKREVEDLKSLFNLFLQKLEVENAKIADAIGMSPGRVSQIVNKNKYTRK